MFDLVLTNGRVIDPASGRDGLFDIAVVEGKVVGVFARGSYQQMGKAKRVLSVENCIVAPGLIDLHTHIFDQETDLGIKADLVGIEQAVTTVVDAGSAGAQNFEHFVAQVVAANVTNVLAWINIAGPGLSEGRSELADLSRIQEQELVAAVKRYDKIIRGIKVRMSSSVLGKNGLQPLILAKQIATRVGLPVMVHIGNAPPNVGEILDLLDAGDVVTHAFHGKAGGILDNNDEPIPELVKAVLRGVKLDLGHGTSSFSFLTMKQALKNGIRPHSISTDIYLGNYPGPVHSLLTTLSKALTLGFSLSEALAAATIAPARILRLGSGAGTLEIGTNADISVLKLLDTDIVYTDSEGNHVAGRQQFQPVYSIKDGKVQICK